MKVKQLIVLLSGLNPEAKVQICTQVHGEEREIDLVSFFPDHHGDVLISDDQDEKSHGEVTVWEAAREPRD